MIYSIEFYILPFQFTLSASPSNILYLEFMLFTMSNFCHLDSITKSFVLKVIDEEILFLIFYSSFSMWHEVIENVVS